MTNPILGIINVSLPVYVERYKEPDQIVKQKTERGKYVILTEGPDIKVSGVDFEDALNLFRIEYARVVQNLVNEAHR